MELRNAARIKPRDERPRSKPGSRERTPCRAAYRPFETLQPYAETGPIFLHRAPCERYDGEALPAWFDHLDPAIVRGYGEDHWIRYDTGHVVPGPEITATCQAILHDASVAYVHIRSKYNCFQCRVDRG